MPAGYPIHQLTPHPKQDEMENSGETYEDAFGNVFSMMTDRMPDADSDYAYKPGKHERMRMLQPDNATHKKEEVIENDLPDADYMDERVMSMMFTSVRDKTTDQVQKYTEQSKRGLTLENVDIQDREVNPAQVRAMQDHARKLHARRPELLPSIQRTNLPTHQVADDQASTQRFAHYKIKTQDTTQNSRKAVRQGHFTEHRGSQDLPQFRESRGQRLRFLPNNFAPANANLTANAVPFTPGLFNLRTYVRQMRDGRSGFTVPGNEMAASSASVRMRQSMESTPFNGPEIHMTHNQPTAAPASMRMQVNDDESMHPQVPKASSSSTLANSIVKGTVQFMGEERGEAFRATVDTKQQDMDEIVKQYMRARKEGMADSAETAPVAPVALSHEDQFQQSVKKIFRNNTSSFDLSVPLQADQNQNEMDATAPVSSIRQGKETEEAARGALQAESGAVGIMAGNMPAEVQEGGHDQMSLDLTNQNQVIEHEDKEIEVNVREIKKLDAHENARSMQHDMIIDMERVLVDDNSTKKKQDQLSRSLNEMQMKFNKSEPTALSRPVIDADLLTRKNVDFNQNRNDRLQGNSNVATNEKFIGNMNESSSSFVTV